MSSDPTNEEQAARDRIVGGIWPWATPSEQAELADKVEGYHRRRAARRWWRRLTRRAA